MRSSTRNPRIGERVVVQRSIGVKVIPGRTVPINAVRPLLLQRDAEQRHPAGRASHHVQKIANVGALLNIVGQVEMRIIEFILVGFC